MAQRITTWHPDTCGCVINMAWDDSVSETDRVHALESIQKCAIHQSLADQDAFDMVNDENKTKNQFLGVIHSDHPELCDVKENGALVLKPEYDYVWSFDENRKLQAEITGVDKATAQAIDASVKTALGEEKIDVKIP